MRHMLSFDPLTLRSTSWRERRMMKSPSSSSTSDHCPIVVRHFGVDVRFHPGRFHYSAEELEPYRKVGDPEVDALLEHIIVECGADGRGGGRGGAFDDVVDMAHGEYIRNTRSPPCEFYRHHRDCVPHWVDYDSIQRGMDVFLAYLPAAGCALFYRSLVGGFSIPKIARVLVATRYLVPGGGGSSGGGDDGSNSAGIANDVRVERDRRRSEERLIDTGGFLACCFAPPPPPCADGDGREDPMVASSASLRPGGRGWEAALRVRVLHAKVRRSLLLRGANAPSSWDVDANGVPINQEDMAATLLAFSVNVLIGIEIAAGRPLNGRDQRDYLALWRYLGWLLGVPDGLGGRRGGMGRRCADDAADDDDVRLVPIDPCGPRRACEADDGRLIDVRSERNAKDVDDYYHNDDIDPDDDPIIHSYATLESMILHLLHPDKTSRVLVNHMLGLRRSVVFRAEVCRIFLGDPLSDELGIPKSRANWVGWRWESLRDLSSHLWVKFFLYVFLAFLRCYTLLTMTCPWFRRRAVVWHGSLEGRFLRVWKKAHEGRVTEAASRLKGPTSTSMTKNSHCPFAMVMDPSSG
jgi:hypothetical protein